MYDPTEDREEAESEEEQEIAIDNYLITETKIEMPIKGDLLTLADVEDEAFLLGY